MEDKDISFGLRGDRHICVRLCPNLKHIELLLHCAHGAPRLPEQNQTERPDKPGRDVTVTVVTLHTETLTTAVRTQS